MNYNKNSLKKLFVKIILLMYCDFKRIGRIVERDWLIVFVIKLLFYGSYYWLLVIVVFDEVLWSFCLG